MTLMMTLMSMMIIGNASRATCRVVSLLYFVEFCCRPVLSQKSKANGYKSCEVDGDRGNGQLRFMHFFIIRHNKDLC